MFLSYSVSWLWLCSPLASPGSEDMAAALAPGRDTCTDAENLLTGARAPRCDQECPEVWLRFTDRSQGLREGRTNSGGDLLERNAC